MSAKRYVVYPGLNSADALRLLAEFVMQFANQPEQLKLLGYMALRTSAALMSDATFAIALEDPTQNAQLRALESGLRTFHALYSTIIKGQPEISPSAEGFAPLLPAFPSLLKSRYDSQAAVDAETNIAAKRHIARPRDDEFLMIADDPDLERETDITRRLRLATSFRIATVSVNGAKSAANYTLFYVKDDELRQSGFEMQHVTDGFADGQLLDCFHVDIADRTVAFFLPDGIRPNAEALGYFCQILATAPDLFGFPPLPEAAETLAAISDKNRLLYLGDVAFSESYEVAPTITVENFEYVQLANSAAELNKLRARIAEVDDTRGYRLYLAPSSYTDYDQQEYERLKGIQEDLERRLSELAFNLPARPRLYRFTQAQLPVLVDFLRTYSPIHLPDILYAYQAPNEGHKSGLHFLWIPNDLPRHDFDPLIWWGDSEKERIEFWLDPLWAQHYTTYENEAFVFVPYGSRLEPSFHSWEVSTMDDYLRTVTGKQWNGGQQSVPQRPIYVFDGVPQYREDVFVMLLDRDQFAPVNTPHVIGWMNRNLRLLDKVGVEAFIAGMADTVAQSELKRNLEAEAQTVEGRFATVSASVKQTMGDDAAKLLRTLSDVFNALTEAARTFTDDAQKISSEMAKLRRYYEAIQLIATEAQASLDKTDAERERLELNTINEFNRVTNAIEVAKERRENAISRIQSTVSDLQNTHERLQDELGRLRDDLSGR
ncbi:MAG: hypothetical protein H7175_27575 [Burkholderiales bacterium]|nr:hypothetical protein [Anaerolineae bacterium]